MKKSTKRLIAQLVFIVVVFAVWELYYYNVIEPSGKTLLFPELRSVGKAFMNAFTVNGFGAMVAHSMQLMLKGLLIGVILALIFSSLAVVSDTFYAIYNMIVSMFDLIPGIALTPIAILWLGIGDASIIFIVIHSVVWPMSRSIIDGFNAVPKLYLEVGENIGLSPVRLVFGVFLPAALSRIFSGIKMGWARAWRGLISAEMLFGSGGSKGIGYYITDRRTNMDIAGVFATILVIILIGLVVEYGVFRTIENHTFKKWGMSR